MKLPKNSLLPKPDIDVKVEPASPAQIIKNKNVKPTRRKAAKAVTATAIEMLENALAPTKDANSKVRRTLAADNLTVAGTYEAFGIFEQAVGGRKALMDVLKYLPTGSTGEALLHRLAEDPDFLAIGRSKNDEEIIRYGLAVLCRRHKLPLNTLVAAFRDAKIAQMAIETLTQLAPHAPEIITQVVNDSKNRYEACTVCEGTARVPRIGENGEFLLTEEGEPETQLCYECRGTGKVFQRHDLQNRKMFLQMTRLLETDKGRETNVNIGLQSANLFNGQFLPGDGSFERIVKGVNINYAPTQALITEVVDVPNTQYETDASNSAPATADAG